MKARKFIYGFCFWFLANLALMLGLNEEVVKKYGVAFNLITIPAAVLLTKAIFRAQEETDTEEAVEDEHISRRQQAFEYFEKERKAAFAGLTEKMDYYKNEIMNEDYSLYLNEEQKGTALINEKTFDDIKQLSILLYGLAKNTCGESDFLAKLKKISTTEASFSAYWWNIKTQLVKDVLRCYKEMGYSQRITFSTAQGQCLYVFTRLVAGESEKFDYTYEDLSDDQMFEDIKKEYIKNTNQMLRVFKEFQSETKSTLNIDDLNLCFIFGVYDPKIEAQFRLLIFRFCQLLARLDGKISKAEKEWLSTILHNEMVLMYDKGEEDEEKPEWIKVAQEKLNHTNGRIKKLVSKKEEVDDRETIVGSLHELYELIGLHQTKVELSSLANYVQMKQIREEMGMKSPDISYHCVFSGNPGTGKTTVARILARVYRDLGILTSGHLVETDRSGLVAEYVGQTAIKTNKIIDEALDGVLFIDEAYSLIQGGNEDYGKEAISTLLKRMEDDRNRLVVILAGYTNEIEQFINSNPGLRSRFNRYIHFEDYTAEELHEIFCLQMKKNEYIMSDEVSRYLKEQLETIVANKPKDFGNARYIRNLFEKAIEAQANRLSSLHDLTKDDISAILKEDLTCCFT